MWEDYSDFISNFRDDLEEPYILPDYFRFNDMCRSGTLGDYLGLPTFGTSFSSTVTLPDKPCSPNSRHFKEDSIENVMNLIRSDSTLDGFLCANHFNYNNKGVVIFSTERSSTRIPSGVTQVGINVSLVGGSADAFIGSRGFLVHVLDDGSYYSDYPVTITKSKDGVVDDGLVDVLLWVWVVVFEVFGVDCCFGCVCGVVSVFWWLVCGVFPCL